MMRAPPLASQGLVKEPAPLEFVGQSWGGSDAALAAGVALTLALAGAGAEGVAAALALALAAGVVD